MSDLLALDVAVLPPPEARARAVALSAEVPRAGGDGVVLDDTHLPHITLTQQYIRVDELEPAFERIDEVLRGQPPLPLRVIGGGRGGHSVWMLIEKTPSLVELHERLMEALRGFERPGGTAAAFFEQDARLGDVIWVASYRLKSSFGAYTPHITLGPGSDPPRVEPIAFTADTIAACHLGRHCSCRQVLRNWTLMAA